MGRQRGKRGLEKVGDLLRQAAVDPDVHPAIRATIAGELVRQEKGRPEPARPEPTRPPAHTAHPGCPCIECFRAYELVP